MDIDQRRARREARRRERARRRARGLAVVGVLVVAVLLAAVLLGGGDSSKPASTGNVASEARGTRSHSPTQHSSPTSIRSTTAAAGAPSGSHGTEPVPILMYHVINPPPPGAKFPGLYVRPREFAAQMQALSRAGFHAVTMDQMLANWAHGTQLPSGKPVVVSFDNGYQSQLTQALPVLRALGWVGVENIQLTGLPPSQGGLSEAQVAQLVKAGWELDTQGISHADLITLGAKALHEEIVLARTELRRRYRVPVNWFCYPSGHYNATVIAEVKAAGYVGSTTVVPGWANPRENLYRLPRLRVLGGTSGSQLLDEIAAIRSSPAPPTSYGAG